MSYKHIKQKIPEKTDYSWMFNSRFDVIGQFTENEDGLLWMDVVLAGKGFPVSGVEVPDIKLEYKFTTRVFNRGLEIFIPEGESALERITSVMYQGIEYVLNQNNVYFVPSKISRELMSKDKKTFRGFLLGSLYSE